MILQGINISETIELPASKSISNRLLIIQFLFQNSFEIHNLSDANDTVILKEILESLKKNNQHELQEINAKDAGTVYRFLTALLCIQNGNFLLTGTERMLLRPIGELVKILQKLGGNIEYQNKKNFPPLSISGNEISLKNIQNIEIDLSESSQYLSALLLIAPNIKNGLEISISGKIVSEPYIQMTIDLMENFGINVLQEGSFYKVKQGQYLAKNDFNVEADWSAASYFYAWSFLMNQNLKINNLFLNSLQGDQVLTNIFLESFGIKSNYENGFVNLDITHKKTPQNFEYDFTDCPDIAPTFVVLCAILGINGVFKGVEHLKIKESDRMNVLKFNLQKLGIMLNQNNDFWELESHHIDFKSFQNIILDSFQDHRMAMSLSLFAAVISNIEILNADCVKKSFPTYFSQIN